MTRNFSIRMLVILLFFLFLPGQVFAGKISGTVNVRGLRSPKNILVYLTKAPQTALGFSSTNFVMDQKNLTFNPHILPVPVGATVHFPNNDELNHNVFSLSRTKKFNLGSYKPGESNTVVFDKPGIVELRCDVHAEMLAYILVLKNPYFGITDAKGRFEIPDSKYLNQFGISGIKDLPSGKYQVKSWHEKLKTGKQKIDIPENGRVSIQLDLTRGTPSVLYKR